MSLDVYLEIATAVKVPLGPRIYVRQDGATREVTRAEWDALYPGREPVVVAHEDDDYDPTVYTANITHNLGRMAAEAGIYEACWHPDRIGVTRAHELIGPLRDGLAVLQSEPSRFEALNPKNGWGDYAGFVRFVAAYLKACERWPVAEVRTWT